MTDQQPAPDVAGTMIGLGLCHSCVVRRKQAEGTDAPLPVVNAAITLVPSAAAIPGPDGQIVGMTAVALPACYGHIPMGRPAGQPSLLLATMRGA